MQLVLPECQLQMGQFSSLKSMPPAISYKLKVPNPPLSKLPILSHRYSGSPQWGMLGPVVPYLWCRVTKDKQPTPTQRKLNYYHCMPFWQGPMNKAPNKCTISRMLSPSISTLIWIIRIVLRYPQKLKAWILERVASYPLAVLSLFFTSLLLPTTHQKLVDQALGFYTLCMISFFSLMQKIQFSEQRDIVSTLRGIQIRVFQS